MIYAIDRDAAAIALVDSNLQREKILPSEKAFAYKLKLEALKHQGTSSQVGTKLRSDEMIAQQTGDSRNQVQRYVRLTNLIPGILQKVDEGRIALTPAVELSYLTDAEQEDLLETMESEDCTPSLFQAIQMKALSQSGQLDMDTIFHIMTQPKANQQEKISFKASELRDFFPRHYTAAQISALENQLDWYKPLLDYHPEWTLVERYIDEGITGTSAEKRGEFMRMIEDAKKHKFDMILTREVSRFARNTVDTLQYTRMLKEHGVEVYFINDGIKTFDGDGELRLTIMATLAQDESRKTSIRAKSGQQTSMNNGVYYGNGNILGYIRVETILPDKTKLIDYVIDPEQAETVRMIFDLYLDGYGLVKIKHEPIVTVEEYERVQRIMESKTNNMPYLNKGSRRGKHARTTVWGKLLICECGHTFNIRRWDRPDRQLGNAYQCYSSVHTGSYENRKKKGLPLDGICQTPMIPEWRLQMMANLIFRKYLSQKDKVLALANSILENYNENTDEDRRNEAALEMKQRELGRLQKRMDNLIEMRADGDLSKDMFRMKSEVLEPKMQKLQKEIEELSQKREPKVVEHYKEKLTILQYALSQYSCPKEGEDVPESVIEAYFSKIVVKKDGFDRYIRINGDPDKPLHCKLEGKRRSTTKVVVTQDFSPALDSSTTGCHQGLIAYSNSDAPPSDRWGVLRIDGFWVMPYNNQNYRIRSGDYADFRTGKGIAEHFHDPRASFSSCQECVCGYGRHGKTFR